jgi:hypothetical protein
MLGPFRSEARSARCQAVSPRGDFELPRLEARFEDLADNLRSLGGLIHSCRSQPRTAAALALRP